MTDKSRMEVATELLQDAYGKPDLPAADSTWALFLIVLFGLPVTHPAYSTLQELLRSYPLSSPRETEASSAGQLVEVLSPIPRGSQKASVVRAVAHWWQAEFGDETSPDWSRDVTSYRESLRQIRGLGPATVDELLLFAAGLRVFPVDRSALRVAVRHGWLDLPIDDEQAQSTFLQGMKHTEFDLREFSLLLHRVGEAHCGREPKCDDCPLKSQLPAGGPLNPSSV